MANVKIGLSMVFCLGEPFKKMVERLSEVKTHFIEIVDEGLHSLNKNRIQILNELAASYSLKYIVHSPFADINIASPSKSLLNTMLKRLKKSILYASALNCQVWVFHPGLKTGVSMFYPGMEWIQNLETVRFLHKFACEHGLEVAIENFPEPYPFVMKSVRDFERFYREVDQDVGLALDIGHANINGQIEMFLTTLGNRIIHIHAHDNYGKADQHLGIGHGTTNWTTVANLVRKIRYDRIITVESFEHVEESISKLKQLFAQSPR